MPGFTQPVPGKGCEFKELRAGEGIASATWTGDYRWYWFYGIAKAVLIVQNRYLVCAVRSCPKRDSGRR